MMSTRDVKRIYRVPVQYHTGTAVKIPGTFFGPAKIPKLHSPMNLLLSFIGISEALANIVYIVQCTYIHGKKYESIIIIRYLTVFYFFLESVNKITGVFTVIFPRWQNE